MLWLAIARIVRPDRYGRYVCTVGGDALFELDLPANVGIYRPECLSNNLQELLKPARDGIYSDSLPRIQLLSIAPSGKGKYALSLDIAHTPAEFTDNLPGSWLCIPASDMVSDSTEEIYTFELLKADVLCADSGEKVGSVIDFLETSGHGNILIQTIDDREVMIPFISNYIRWEKSAADNNLNTTVRLIVTDWEDFLV